MICVYILINQESVRKMAQEKVSMLRYRGSKLNKVKELDFFPKVEDDFKETSSVGGTCTRYYR